MGTAVVLLILIGYLWLYAPTSTNTAMQSWCFQTACFQLEVADTPQQRMQGLMFRTQVKKNQGMVFIFPDEAMHPFWMKNTIVPLDMIRLNS